MTDATEPTGLALVPTDEKILNSATYEVPGEPGEIPGLLVVTNEGVPTQVANPTRTTVRTLVQAFLPLILILVPLLNGVLLAVSDYLRTQTDVTVAPWVFLVLNGAIGITGLLIGLVSRIMSTPGVNEFLARFVPWLTPIPLKALDRPEHL